MKKILLIYCSMEDYIIMRDISQLVKGDDKKNKIWLFLNLMEIIIYEHTNLKILFFSICSIN